MPLGGRRRTHTERQTAQNHLWARWTLGVRAHGFCGFGDRLPFLRRMPQVNLVGPKYGPLIWAHTLLVLLGAGVSSTGSHFGVWYIHIYIYIYLLEGIRIGGVHNKGPWLGSWSQDLRTTCRDLKPVRAHFEVLKCVVLTPKYPWFRTTLAQCQKLGCPEPFPPPSEDLKVERQDPPVFVVLKSCSHEIPRQSQFYVEGLTGILGRKPLRLRAPHQESCATQRNKYLMFANSNPPRHAVKMSWDQSPPVLGK